MTTIIIIVTRLLLEGQLVRNPCPLQCNFNIIGVILIEF